MISSLNLLRLLVPRSGATPFGSIARTGFLQSTALPATLRCPQKFSSSAASVEEAVNAASSATPEVMYSGRTGRLQKFIDQQTSNGKTPLTMDMMLKAGHRSQYHYLGIQANDHIIDFFGDTIVGLVPGKGRGKGRFNWAEQKKLIDVGSGIGGPGQYIAWKTGCAIDGFEIQPELVKMANKVGSMGGNFFFEKRNTRGQR